MAAVVPRSNSRYSGSSSEPTVTYAFGHTEAEIARDERLERPLEAIRRGTGAAAQLQHVPEAARGDEPRHRALPFEQRVRRRRRAVDEDLDRRGRHAGLA